MFPTWKSLIWKLSKQINFGLKSTLSKTLILIIINNYGNLDKGLFEQHNINFSQKFNKNPKKKICTCNE